MHRSILIILFFLSLLICLQVKAGGQRDSLLKVLAAAKIDTVKINTLNMLAEDAAPSNLDSAILFSLQAAEVLRSSEEGEKNSFYPNRLHALHGYTYLQLGSFYNEKGQFDIALNHLQEALKVYQDLNDKKGIAGCLGNIGLLHIQQSDYPKALEKLFQALKIDEALNNKSGILSKLGNIGIAYDELGEYDKSLDYYHRALKLAQELKDERRTAVQYSNIGVIYSKKREYEKSREYYFKALRLDDSNGNRGWSDKESDESRKLLRRRRTD
jgi:tetratricopeptide (TPR) repeat protein